MRFPTIASAIATIEPAIRLIIAPFLVCIFLYTIAAVTLAPKETSTAIIVPSGFVNRCGANPSMLTIAAAAGPYANPATRHTIPEGSYFRNEKSGISGNSMKLTAIESATNSAYFAIFSLDQRAFEELI